MTLITFPSSPGIQAQSLRIFAPSQETTSEWTGHRKVQPSGRAWWQGTITMPPMSEDEALSWRAFVAKARGRSNAFQVPVRTGTQSTANPLVNGGSQTGYQLITDAWGVSEAIKAGWYFTLGGQLHIITTNVTANGSGEATITFEPALRSSPANNAAIEIEDPYMTAAMMGDELGWSSEPGVFHSFSFEIREAF